MDFKDGSSSKRLKYGGLQPITTIYIVLLRIRVDSSADIIYIVKVIGRMDGINETKNG